jgi:flagellar assembly factor FliW
MAHLACIISIQRILGLIKHPANRERRHITISEITTDHLKMEAEPALKMSCIMNIFEAVDTVKVQLRASLLVDS